MADATHGLGGLKYDPAKRTRAPEWNVFGALVLIVLVFEILNRMQGGSFLFNMRDNVDAIFNQQRLDIMILQVAIIGIIALGVTQVILTGGIDLSSGSVVGMTAMIAMSFAQVGEINGLPNTRAVFHDRGWVDLPVIIFACLALLFGLIMKYTVYGKHTYAIGSNEAAARMSGINVNHHKVLVYVIAGILASLAAIVLSSKNLTAQAGMGVMYELDAIAMTVIGGVSLSGGRGSILGTVLGALIFGVIISGFTFLRLDAYYQEMDKGAIIVGAVVLDQWRQRRAAARM